jgi:hypothetical protein
MNIVSAFFMEPDRSRFRPMDDNWIPGGWSAKDP